MRNTPTAYAPIREVDTMQLPSYSEYQIGDTTYKVSSIFAEKGSLKEIYEKFIINSEKGMQSADI